MIKCKNTLSRSFWKIRKSIGDMKKLMKSVGWKPFVSDSYLYLHQTLIVSLPSFQEVDCQQDFPENPMREASAGVVMDGNLLVCGGFGMTTCRLWTEYGWKETVTGFNRYYKRGFEYFYRPYLGFQYSKLVLDNILFTLGFINLLGWKLKISQVHVRLSCGWVGVLTILKDPVSTPHISGLLLSPTKYKIIFLPSPPTPQNTWTALMVFHSVVNSLINIGIIFLKIVSW